MDSVPRDVTLPSLDIKEEREKARNAVPDDPVSEDPEASSSSKPWVGG